MAYRRTTNYFYDYYVMSLTGMIRDTHSVPPNCLCGRLYVRGEACFCYRNCDSTTLLLATFISFLNGLGEGGIQTPFLCFSRDRFQYNKDNFAALMLICYGGAIFSQLILMPKLAGIIGKETILFLALIAGFSNMLIDSIAWAAWVPYVVALFPMFLFPAALQSIVSKQIGPNEQLIAIIPSMMISWFGTYNSRHKVRDVHC